ncbi:MULTISPECIES: Fur family transcriptional regulator [unclassified Brevundimonas]|uniref:Fur family transcriptional regulator n=1 Tax=unclassified Brevundimonas TaxID=2622653 RepID=UPI0006FD1492|nr:MULTISPECIES: Fur family transcriptional regulator [unclassified Brevundimonas]KQY91097.1 Fur family transcriptional regulator [Brevundimonas sp. Root1423]KRA22047.1 Fur family transcriptional regulator [Brevundimonas sp. Root608]
MSEHCHHHHDDGPPAAADVARAMGEADRRLTAEGERMTAARLRVLELLLAAGEPVKAYDLIARFGDDGQPAKPPTVYRALEFLERKGLAHRIASISAYVACTSGGIDHAAAFLICDCCGATQEVSAPVAGDLGRAAEAAGYAIVRTTIEAHGRCSACVAG